MTVDSADAAAEVGNSSDEDEGDDDAELPSVTALTVRGFRTLRRVLDVDEMLPSYGRMVTAACLRALAKLAGKGIITTPKKFHEYLQAPMPINVRIAAIESLASTTVVNSTVAAQAAKADAYGRPEMMPPSHHVLHWLNQLEYVFRLAEADRDPRLRVSMVMFLYQAQLQTVRRSEDAGMLPAREENYPRGALGAWTEEPLQGGCLSLLSSRILFPMAVNTWESLEADHKTRVALRAKGRDIVDRLWYWLNEGSANHWVLRRVVYHLYAAIWGCRAPPAPVAAVAGEPDAADRPPAEVGLWETCVGKVAYAAKLRFATNLKLSLTVGGK